MNFIIKKKMIMLTCVLTAMVNKPFLKKKNDKIFIENKKIKNCQNINYFFSFPIKNFFK